MASLAAAQVEQKSNSDTQEMQHTQLEAQENTMDSINSYQWLKDKQLLKEIQQQSNIVKFYQNRSVLITGGSGFIGKVLIEKLLRTCPEIRSIFVLIRPKWNKQPQERLQELLKVPLFDVVRELDSSLLKKVIVVEGDVERTNLGLSDRNLLRIMNEVSVIYHSAATVKFDEPLKQSIAINMAGTKNMIELCRKIPQLAALVHISTAYANCDHVEVDEHIYPVELDPERLIELAKWLDQPTLQELKFKLLREKPNTYTYTKSLAEWLLLKCARDLPVVICRPSIVCASWREPFAGWVDNVNGPTGVILGTGKGLIRSMMAEKKFIADWVPVDTVINLAITLGWFAHIYRNHKQSNDAAESLSESLIGTDSLSSVDEPSSLDEGENLRMIRASPELSLHSGNNNNNNSDTGNNNNNSTSYHATCDKAGHEQLSDGNYQHQQHLYHQLQVNPDEGYGTYAPSLSPGTKSSASTESHSIVTASETSSSGDKTLSKTIMMSYVERRRLDEQEHAAFQYKLKQFRHNSQVRVASKKLPEEIADIPVFHSTSGSEKPISWGEIQVIVLYYLMVYPSISIYRYPSGSFTSNRRLDKFYRFTLHTLPAHLVDFLLKLFGSKPLLVKIFSKFNQAAAVLEAFTMKQWKFNTDNNRFLMNELMSKEDRLLFNFDVSQLDWTEFLKDYVLGVRQFMLKEPINNLRQARVNLKVTYYRNLGLQFLFILLLMYYFMPSIVPQLIIRRLF